MIKRPPECENGCLYSTSVFPDEETCRMCMAEWTKKKKRKGSKAVAKPKARGNVD